MAVTPGSIAPQSALKRKKVPNGGIMMSSAATGSTRATPASGISPGFGAQPGFASPPPPAWGGVPPNPTHMTTYGPYSQQTDQMGRVITTTAPGRSQLAGGYNVGPNGMLTQAGTPGMQVGTEDPDQQRRSRDLTDYESRLEIDRRYATPPQQMDVEEDVDIRKLLDILDDQGGTAARESPMALPPRATGEPEADRRAAEAAEFGRAKDRVARIARGAGKSLEGDMVGRGLVGSGIEARNMRDIVRGGQGDLANVATEQAIASLQRRNQVADRNYAGDVSQRGQDIGVGSTNLGAGVTQRGQDLDQRRSLLALLPSVAAISRRRVAVR